MTLIKCKAKLCKCYNKGTCSAAVIAMDFPNTQDEIDEMCCQSFVYDSNNEINKEDFKNE